MSPIEKAVLVADAKRKLQAYLSTGMTGFRDQAFDRARAIGVRTDLFAEGLHGARQLLKHLSDWHS